MTTFFLVQMGMVEGHQRKSGVVQEILVNEMIYFVGVKKKIVLLDVLVSFQQKMDWLVVDRSSCVCL